METQEAVRLITERQAKYLTDLLITAGKLTPEIAARIPKLSRESAGKWIEKARALPPLPKWAAVPDGYYAVKHADGITRFYQVQSGSKDTKWEGHRFLKIQASDEWYPYRGDKSSVIASIQQNPQAAAKLYGIEIGACGICNRTLTDETSRAIGLGPVCRERYGW